MVLESDLRFAHFLGTVTVSDLSADELVILRFHRLMSGLPVWAEREERP